MARGRAGKSSDGLVPIGDLITFKLRRQIKASAGPTPIQQRLLDTVCPRSATAAVEGRISTKTTPWPGL